MRANRRGSEVLTGAALQLDNSRLSLHQQNLADEVLCRPRHSGLVSSTKRFENGPALVRPIVILN